MSYLDLPRVHLFGQFFANPSTINNSSGNYDPSVALQNSMEGPGAVYWNPRGQALWKMDVGVRTALAADGTPVTTDPLLNGRLTSIPVAHHAKLVDLDPDQQFVSQVWGLNVQLTLADGTVAFTGSVDPCALQDLWLNRVVNSTAGGNWPASGAFQSVVRVRWGNVGSSPLLQQLRSASPNALSIRWVVDRYNSNADTAGFGYGRMVATLGPQDDAEPAHVVMGRRLESSAAWPLLWFGVARLAGTRLTLDLGNSVAVDDTSADGSPVVFESPLALAAVSAAGSIPLGTLDYTLEAYQSRAGIFDLQLSPTQAAAAAAGALQLGATVPASLSYYSAQLGERTDGLYVNAGQSFMRLDPGQSDTCTVYAAKFGQPATLCVTLQVTTGDAGPDDGLTVPLTVQVENGSATIDLVAGSIGNPRGYVDGQLYYVSPSTWPQLLTAPMLSVLVFGSAFEPANPPTWADVGPILTGFARLYPGMRDILDLSDYGTMKANASRLKEVLSLPITDPNYMPVTRDLSRARRQAILDWIDHGCPAAPGSTAPPADGAAQQGQAPARTQPLPNDYHLK